MDLFCEYLVKKKSMSDNLKRAGLILACAAVCFAIIYFSLFVKRAFISAMPILVAAAIYGTVIFGRNFSLEYEYIFTNGVLDIDVIKGRARRAKLISVPCRKIEYMGPVKEKPFMTKNARENMWLRFQTAAKKQTFIFSRRKSFF